MFLTKEGRIWVAVDNTTGDAWTEEFSRKRQAVRWLRGMFEVEEEYVRYREEDGSFICQATPKDSGGEYLYIGCWEVEQKPTITKAALRLQLQQGHTLNDLLLFGPGQDCEIFKTDRFYPGDLVIYVPDVALNHIPLDRPITDTEELYDVLSQCYTGQDFINECGGDAEKVGQLFRYCDWQHPSSAMDELADDEEEAYRYMADVAELSDTEAEYFGLDMEKYKNAAMKTPSQLRPAQAAITVRSIRGMRLE